ncbi:hypothetical protein CLOM_g22071 [Closterium sp. NIES-68]|nr:hypothetical protein CLOM_g22071 [Closterium sp. NIES-68]GJP63111.1 hypothetical protein CLOP_g20190 [Closterium sp. NIES-67]GJP68712.1 hypothetical protein CLOP_g25375 [Closterium sp. NIES-67]GJP78014.1 hypothetical protein CLOP_g8347 [Closterium sp. NIES-67]
MSLAPPLKSLLSSAASLPAPPSLHLDLPAHLEAVSPGVADSLSLHGHVASLQPDNFAVDISRLADIGATLLWLQPFTESEIAGLVFGAAIIACAASAPRVDQWIARAQRRNLCICEECGGVGFLPCTKCNKQASMFQLPALGTPSLEPPKPLPHGTSVVSEQKSGCSCCGGKGRVVCPKCV